MIIEVLWKIIKRKKCVIIVVSEEGYINSIPEYK